jgi:hypothetical protein
VAESVSLQNRLNGFKPHFNFLEGENIVDELKKFEDACPIDLLMVFPRKHGIFGSFHKKISKLIVTHNQFPVLSIHDKK